MAALDDLLARVGDPSLRAALNRELSALRGDRELGLVFERHLPERVRLHGVAPRRGASVEILNDPSSPVWQVSSISSGTAMLRRRLERAAWEHTSVPVSSLVVVREFGTPVYPGLRSVGSVARGADKPFHTVINAENYHALETLQYVCPGQVDAIYIDPPYNSGSRDWKYNNDYVDKKDDYRHSKWLSFMEKRLRLARKLLRPERSVLIVAIDENEVHRLALLLEEVFGRVHQRVR